MPHQQPELAGGFLEQHYRDPSALTRVSRFFTNALPPNRNIVFLCIGIDRSSGDAFGPLTGTLLRQYGVRNVTGTLDSPVHAGNLRDVVAGLDPRAYVVAVDAALGRAADVGKVLVRHGAVRPGTALNRDLPMVGEMVVLLNVGVGGICNHLFLNHASLNVVWRGARLVSGAVAVALRRLRSEGEAGQAAIPKNRVPMYDQRPFDSTTSRSWKE